MMRELLRALLEASLSADVMVLAILVLRLRFQDRTPRKAFCLLWDMVLVRLLLPGALPSPVSIRRWIPLQTHLTADAAVQPATVTVTTEGQLLGEVWQTAYLADGTLQYSFADSAAAPIDRTAVCAGLWLGIALLLALGFLWSHLRGRKIYASSLPFRDGFVSDWLAERPLRRPIQVRCSDRIAAPLTYGVLYPVILLPRGVDWGDDLPCVLAHEYEHIRRFDALRKPLLAGALCLH